MESESPFQNGNDFSLINVKYLRQAIPAVTKDKQLITYTIVFSVMYRTYLPLAHSNYRISQPCGTSATQNNVDTGQEFQLMLTSNINMREIWDLNDFLKQSLEFAQNDVEAETPSA